jgi:2-iminoacetate synthase
MSPQATDGGKKAAMRLDAERLKRLASQAPVDPVRVRDIIAKSLDKQALDEDETAALLSVSDPELVAEILDAARTLKNTVYGNRIVLFAPLYIGNDCINDCAYCAFRRSNTDVERITLTAEQIENQVRALEDVGHKRLILVFGEHPTYDADFIADSVRRVYATKSGKNGEIRRVNINAAPLSVEDYKKVKAAGIGTYQVFMETYDPEIYAQVHPPHTRKGDYSWRLDGVGRAIEAGCDDVGIGVLFGLSDWRFDLLALVAHARHLSDTYGVGPHTISFPRLKPAHNTPFESARLVDDATFTRIVATLRLAVPYTGLILTAREPAALRREIMGFGVSQIDAGTRIELGGYGRAGEMTDARKEQFSIGDARPLDVVMRELIDDGYLPSFCTACYRVGRTGEHFMEFAIPGFIKRFCTPNALLTLSEYLADYASDTTLQAGEALVAREVAALVDGPRKKELIARLDRIRKGGERDLHF